MGGELRAESEPGKGSAFTLSLPLVERDEAAAAPLQVAADPAADRGRFVRLNILVAEDNPVNQELTKAMVEKAGHDCTLVHDGQQALDTVVQASRDGAPFDMVLMDMQMPEMDGLKASQEIRNAGIDGGTLPILAVTANAYSEDVQRCVDAGMQAHLAKPVHLDALRAAISQWSPMVEERAIPATETIEEETDPALRSMFENRLADAAGAIDTALSDGSLSGEQRREIADLLHQTAGVAAYFGQRELGDFCRDVEGELLATEDQAQVMPLLGRIRTRLSQARTKA